MKFRKLEALKAFVISLGVIAEENIQAWYVLDEYKPSGIEISETEFCVYDQSYTAVIRIERFPREKDILIELADWFNQYDPRAYRFKVNRNGDKPIPLNDIIPNLIEESSETVAIELLVEFREPVFGIFDVNGQHNLNDSTYRIATDEEATDLEPSYILNADYDAVDWRRER